MKLLIASFLVFSANVMADQCEWTNKSIAVNAVNRINDLASANNQAPSIYTQCEPCGETELVRMPLGLKADGKLNVSFKKADSSDKTSTFWTISVTDVNGQSQEIDLAYVYLKTGTSTYTNLANMVACPVAGVSPFLYGN